MYGLTTVTAKAPSFVPSVMEAMVLGERGRGERKRERREREKREIERERERLQREKGEGGQE
eukprot:308644-Amorphochlora_amoeboformis.AAC.1